MVEYVLAGRSLGGDGGALDVGSGLVSLVGLLGEKDNTTVLTGLDTDGLLCRSQLYSFFLFSLHLCSFPPLFKELTVSWKCAYLVGDKTLVLLSLAIDHEFFLG